MNLSEIKLAITMPAFNESSGIIAFLEDIYKEFQQKIGFLEFIVADDRSTDTTVLILEKSRDRGFPIKIIESTLNTGSGPATHRAWSFVLNGDYDVVLNTDSDGQYSARALLEMVRVLITENLDVVEGNRILRKSSMVRKFGTFMTKFLVLIRSRNFPGDANCPTRAFDFKIFKDLVNKCPANAITPNMWMAVNIRNSELKFKKMDLEFLPRRGGTNIGTLWAGGRWKFSPTIKYFKFCYKAFKNWFLG
jgi:dolichol-phosphate mannosyltransferase